MVISDRMDSRYVVLGIMLLSVSIVGMLVNCYLLSYYLFLYYKKFTQRVIDLILTHLTISNCLIILFQGVPYTLAAFGLKQLFNGWRCNLFSYVQRLVRSVSVGTTCFLSVFQAITISHRNSCWKDLKVKAPKYTGLCISLYWILYIVINSIFPLYMYTKWNINNMTWEKDLEYCAIRGTDAVMESLYAAVFVFPEILFTVLFLWSSVSMVVTLYRHKQQVQHIHSTNVSSRASPESRAIQSILVLISTFVTFYTLSSILNACMALLNHPAWWLVNINKIISLCFPSFGPIVLMSHGSTASRICFVWIRNKMSLNLIRNNI